MRTARLTHQQRHLLFWEDLYVGSVPLFERQPCAREKPLGQAHRVEQARMTVAGQLVAQCLGCLAKRAGQAIELRLVMIAEIASVTSEELVSADPGKDDLDVAARKLGHEIGR